MARLTKILAATAAGAMASLLAAQAQAAVFIGFSTGGSPITRYSQAGDGTFSFNANCALIACGGFSQVLVNGETGIIPTLLHSASVEVKKSGVGNLTIFVTHTNITGGLPDLGYESSFTSNNGVKINRTPPIFTTPFTVTLSTYVDPLDRLYQGTLLSTFTSSTPGASAEDDFHAPIALGTAPFSVTEKYVLHANSGSAGLSTSPSVILSGLYTGTPEPATWGLMVLGFGGAGAILRRRRTLALAA
jgi:hypothetical protein